MSACEFSLRCSFWKYYQLGYSCLLPSWVQRPGLEWGSTLAVAGPWAEEPRLALAQVGMLSPVLSLLPFLVFTDSFPVAHPTVFRHDFTVSGT